MTMTVSTQVCVVGGGPGGLSLALLLARSGISVVAVEQSGHFNRSFRGETISPDCGYLLREMGVLEAARERGYLQVRRMEIDDGGRRVLNVDFGDFDYPQRYPLEIPQHNLLETMLGEAHQYASFTFLPRTRVNDLRYSGDRVSGVRATGPDSEVEVDATLTVAADGRYSRLRTMAGLDCTTTPQQRDVVWLKTPVPDEWEHSTYRIRLRDDRNGVFLPTYPDKVRVGFNIPKGGLKKIRRGGIGELHERLDELAPELNPIVRSEITSWSATSVLDIFTTVVPRWQRPGFAVVGDAAHTFSPILGQGVNHAIVDAVDLAPRLASALRESDAPQAADRAAEAFQRSRESEVRTTRSLQLRQEKAFTLGNPAAVLLRQRVYRTAERVTALRNAVFRRIYFRIQRQNTHRSVHA
ncbi:FAD-dependent oxidoreductase [Streptomonospora salina]|uniref:2-polyprenyl-6-methoxyphenol hydroxylase-like FAD-dependent oxidoreductase n=1 Tax=Streptomonospora salina TaxID=104205 RepID=A0A841EIY7_9ACTN|nr:FAD-dependent oxidoreductase [Streptomonospora salina]MBB6001003.1 2-polyprenyl-6-methoxyphenol hydroxylase-like FAD-dependent oxidoreductase [Streptomonospora salina]